MVEANTDPSHALPAQNQSKTQNDPKSSRTKIPQNGSSSCMIKPIMWESS